MQKVGERHGNNLANDDDDDGDGDGWAGMVFVILDNFLSSSYSIESQSNSIMISIMVSNKCSA